MKITIEKDNGEIVEINKDGNVTVTAPPKDPYSLEAACRAWSLSTEAFTLYMKDHTDISKEKVWSLFKECPSYIEQHVAALCRGTIEANVWWFIRTAVQEDRARFINYYIPENEESDK